MTVTSTPLVDAQATAGNRQMVSAIIASVLGWSLDLFDVFILLYVGRSSALCSFPPGFPATIAGNISRMQPGAWGSPAARC